jgi:hypothetical protein
MYLFYASAFLELILNSVVIKIFIYNLYAFISRYVLRYLDDSSPHPKLTILGISHGGQLVKHRQYLDDSVVYMRDLILAHI